MRRATAAKVVDILGLVEAQLQDGRPRKLPGKPRPEAISIYGTPFKASMSRFYEIQKVSLPAAIILAVREQGYSRTVREYVEFEIRWQYAYASNIIRDWKTVAEIDNDEMDTRMILRLVRAGIREIEEAYLS